MTIPGALFAVASLLLSAQAADGDRQIRKDSTLRGELQDLEYRLLQLEKKLRSKAKLPAPEANITEGRNTPPDLIGRIEEGFDDGVAALFTVTLLPWKDVKASLYVDAAAERRYLDLSRRERRETKGLVVYAWLREGSEDHAARAVFCKTALYDAWEKAGKEELERIEREIKSVLDRQREEESKPLFEAAEIRIRESDIKSEIRKLLKDLKAGGEKGPYGNVTAVDAARGTVKVSFWLDRKQVERSWPLAKKSLVIFDRYRTAKLAEVGIGCRVHTYFTGADRKEISVIECFGGSVGGSRGRMGTVDFKRRLVTIPSGDNEKHPGTFVVPEDARIEIDGREAAFLDLDPAQPIRLQLSGDMKTAIAVRQGGGKR